MASSNDYARFTSILSHLESELATIRTGRANPGQLEAVKVKAYSSLLPLAQVASLSAQDARTLVVQPWDKSLLKDIERALAEADLGMTPVNDGSVLRMTVPMLTEERRREYVRQLGTKLEEARVGIRRIREDAVKALKQDKQAGRLSEDAFFAQQRDLQKEVDDVVAEIDRRGQAKEQEIMTV